MFKDFYNVAVFASGQGSNFLNIIKTLETFTDKKYLKGYIRILITDRDDINAIKIADKYKIPHYTIKRSLYYDSRTFNLSILDLLIKNDIDIIFLAGYLQILGKELIDYYPLRIINIHPSFLPKYRGLDAIKRAFLAGEKKSGVSIHYVNDGVDTGPIILQETMNVDKNFDTFKRNVHSLEHSLYSKTLKYFFYKKKALVVSKCLLGVNSRYDASNKKNTRVLRFVEKYDGEIFFLCPESDGGMSTPREPIDERSLLPQKVKKLIETKVNSLKSFDFIEFILKDKSPSCGTVEKEGEIYFKAKKLLKDKKIIFIRENDL